MDTFVFRSPPPQIVLLWAMTFVIVLASVRAFFLGSKRTDRDDRET